MVVLYISPNQSIKNIIFLQRRLLQYNNSGLKILQENLHEFLKKFQ